MAPRSKAIFEKPVTVLIVSFPPYESGCAFRGWQCRTLFPILSHTKRVYALNFFYVISVFISRITTSLNSQEISSHQVSRTKLCVLLSSLPFIIPVHELSLYRILFACFTLTISGKEHNLHLLTMQWSRFSSLSGRNSFLSSLFSHNFNILTQPLTFRFTCFVQ